MKSIDKAAMSALASDFQGMLILPEDPTYNAARQIWNGHIRRRPRLIARCSGAADVIAAVRFGREHRLTPSVRGGGHAVAGLTLGGGNFGIVTSFKFELHPLGPSILAGMIAWPMADAPRVLSFLRDFIADAPDEVGIMANLRLAPPLPVIPAALHGKPIVALIVTYAGELRNLFRAAGFHVVAIHQESTTVRFADPERFVPLAVTSSAAAGPAFARMEEPARANVGH